MKYLKSYNESISISPDIIQELKDICLELTDKHFSINIVPMGSSYELYISCENFNFFYYNEVSEVIDRIKYFLKSQGYRTTIITSCTGYEKYDDKACYLVTLRIAETPKYDPSKFHFNHPKSNG